MTPTSSTALRAARFAVAFATALTLPLDARTLPPIDALAQAPIAKLAAASDAAKALTAADASVSIHSRLGVPTFLWGRQAELARAASTRTPTPKKGLDEEGLARAYLRDVADLYRIAGDEIAALPMHDLQRFPGGGAIVRFRGAVEGVEVFREEVNVLLDRKSALVAVGGFAMGAPAGQQKRAQAFSKSAAEAAATALFDFGFDAAAAQRLQRGVDADGYTPLALPAGTAAGDGSTLESARAKRVWFRLPARLVAAWYVEVEVRDGSWPHAVDGYAYVISAEDGRVLFRHDQTVDAAFTYRVYAEPTPPYLPLPGPVGRASFPHPTGAPDGVQPPFVVANLVTLESLPFSHNDPWLLPNTTQTYGNNVEAFTNILIPDGYGTPGTDECNLALPVDGDLHACTSSPGTFDHAYDHTHLPGATRTQVGAVVTNLFYMNNFLHDWFYDAGFDEKAGNGQTNNYGRGGLAGDSIFAEAQDFTGSNNANMFTPADGKRPRMRMFVWTSSIALVRVNAPATVAGVKQAGVAEFGAQAFDLVADLALATDAADADGPTTTDGCSAFTNAAAIAGKIAVIDRGVCTFVVKAKNAQNAGAIGVLILNNVAPGAPGMAGTDAAITIPVVSASLADGAAIKAELAKPAAVGLRMARASGTPRDGALDNTLVAHEWGHYISNRLIANAGGLTATQGGGMGEGFADFHALLLLVKDSDRQLPGNESFAGAYPLTAYPLGGPDFAPDVLNQAYYYGIRRYPYSRDMSKNPLTFRHIADATPLPSAPPMSPRGSSSENSEVHNTGEVWASMLWECYSNLLNDSARLSFAQAQDRMKRYLVGGYKMTPAEPTFINARDALLSVMQAQDATDRDLCMQGFAKRGAGVGATAPDQYSQDNAGVVESFRATADAGVPVAVIEFYNQALDHYFITWVGDEIAKLDNGTFKGWKRTGESFNVYANAQVGTSAVCRIYIPPGKGDGHFFGRDRNECDGTIAKNPTFILESESFFHLFPPSLGNCAAGQVPVYRVFSNRVDANHRYTTSRATRDLMVTQGWIAEGDGADTVVMCAPA
ncbi:MAG: M36 family metallopeptidase [Burkholderiales bacterium]|nr:M36 family metallopeptidase [Burkholderiales bacterium]